MSPNNQENQFKIIAVLISIIAILTAISTGFNIATYLSIKNSSPQPPAIQPSQNLPANGPLPSKFDTKISYSDALKKNKPVIVEFYADWCPHCTAFAPEFHKLNKKFKKKATFVTINSEKPENKDLVKEFNVQGFPAIYIVNPKTQYKMEVKNRENLQQEIETIIKSNN